MKKFIAFLIITIILLAGFSCQPTGINSSLGQQFSLSPGQAATIAGEPLQIRFINIANDSRCPEGVMCVWAGEVSCLVDVTYDGSTVRIVLTHSGYLPSVTTFNEYEISFNVEPYPKSGQNLAKKDYRLQLTVTK